jgi:hypothetical protein
MGAMRLEPPFRRLVPLVAGLAGAWVASAALIATHLV